MPKIVQYDIIRAETTDALAKKVSEKIGEGWQPFGSLTSLAVPLNQSYSQAVVKYGQK